MNGPMKIGLLIFLVVVVGFVVTPLVKRARLMSKDMVSQAHLRELGKGLNGYVNQKGQYPAQAIYSKDGKPLLSWRVAILPFLEEQSLYEQFHLDEPWDGEHNQKLIAQIPKAFQSMHLGKDGKTSYLGAIGPGLFFEGTQGKPPAAFTDDKNNTVALVEAGLDKAVVWTKPEDWEVNLEKPFENLGDPIVKGYNLVFIGDAHVDTIDPTVAPAKLKAMLTIAGGEH